LESARRWRDATESTAEIRRAPLGRDNGELIAANKFHRIVLKMREALPFLATFKNDHAIHEDVGRYFDFGAAHDFRRCLYRPDADKRAASGPARELTLAVGAGVRTKPWGTTNAFSGPISQTRERAGGISGIPYRDADIGRLKVFWRLIGSPAGSFRNRLMFRSVIALSIPRRQRPEIC
jgi:hypothetical protein